MTTEQHQHETGSRVRLTVPGVFPDTNDGASRRLGVTLVFRVLNQNGDEVQVAHDVTGRRYVLPAHQLTRA